MGRTVPGPIAGKNNPSIRRVAGRNVIIVCRLPGNPGDGVGAVWQAGEFIQLPKECARVGCALGRVRDHAEESALTAPMNGRITHGDAVGMLQPGDSESKPACNIGQRKICQAAIRFA